MLHGLKNYINFVGERSLLDDTVEHNYRTCSSSEAVDHCTHHEAFRNLEQTSESKEISQSSRIFVTCERMNKQTCKQAK